MTVSPEPRLGELLEAALSRSVRTPLHSVLGFLELLGITGDLDADQRRLLEQLVHSAEGLLTGSDRVTWLVRLMHGGYRPHTQRVDVVELIAEIAAAVGGSVTVHVGPYAPRLLHTDVPALHTLLTELIGNALVHAGGPVTVQVSTGSAGGAAPGAAPAVRILLADSGPGLPASARAVLVGGSDRPVTADTVGVLLAARLTELLGGDLQLEPGGPGTRLALTLPVQPAAAAGTDQPAGASGAARPLRVLLVEDNATNRLLTERQLARLGHELVAVATGEAGVAAALAGGLDVILLDRHLPDLDGCEVARRIRAAGSPSGRQLPIIAITADVTSQTREDCTAAGMDEVLTKPVDLERLGAALSRAAVGRLPDGAGTTAAHRGPVDSAPPALRTILERCDGDVAATAEVISTYLGELPGRRLRLQAALRRGESRAVLAAADSLRTSSESLGAGAVSGACAVLAAAAEAGDLSVAAAFLPRLHLLCDQVHAELAPFCDTAAVEAVLMTAR